MCNPPPCISNYCTFAINKRSLGHSIHYVLSLFKSFQYLILSIHYPFYMAQIPQHYRLENGAYFPNYPYAPGRPYFDPEGLTVLINNNIYHPVEIPLEIFENLTEADKLNIEFFTLDVYIKEERRAAKAELERLEALDLKENIITLAHSISKVYHKRKLKRLEAEAAEKKQKTDDSTSEDS